MSKERLLLKRFLLTAGIAGAGFAFIVVLVGAESGEGDLLGIILGTLLFALAVVIAEQLLLRLLGRWQPPSGIVAVFAAIAGLLCTPTAVYVARGQLWPAGRWEEVQLAPDEVEELRDLSESRASPGEGQADTRCIPDGKWAPKVPRAPGTVIGSKYEVGCGPDYSVEQLYILTADGRTWYWISYSGGVTDLFWFLPYILAFPIALFASLAGAAMVRNAAQEE